MIPGRSVVTTAGQRQIAGYVKALRGHSRAGDTLDNDPSETIAMTDTDTQTTSTTDDGPAAGATATPAAPAFDAEKRAIELAILDNLRSVVDPEIGMNVVELALIKQILLGESESEIKMILTTPFCPYAGSMIQQVKEAAEEITEHPVKITLLAERWDPRDAGLMW